MQELFLDLGAVGGVMAGVICESGYGVGAELGGKGVGLRPKGDVDYAGDGGEG